MLKTGYEDFPQYNAILGIDEVGLGSGAGDLYIAGAILDKEFSHSEVKDSKKLSDKKREKIYGELKASPKLKSYTMIVPVEFINKYGLTKSLLYGFNSVIEHFEGQYDAIFIDGSDSKGVNANAPIHLFVKGDNLYQNIASASVIAKVERDRYMTQMSEVYPNYKFEKNKGYLVPDHISGLKLIGKCPIHRDQYVRNFVNED